MQVQLNCWLAISSTPHWPLCCPTYHDLFRTENITKDFKNFKMLLWKVQRESIFYPQEIPNASSVCLVILMCGLRFHHDLQNIVYSLDGMNQKRLHVKMNQRALQPECSQVGQGCIQREEWMRHSSAHWADLGVDSRRGIIVPQWRISSLN